MTVQLIIVLKLSMCIVLHLSLPSPSQPHQQTLIQPKRFVSRERFCVKLNQPLYIHLKLVKLKSNFLPPSHYHYFSGGCTSCQLIFLLRVHQLPTHISLLGAIVANSYFSIGCNSCQLMLFQRVHQLPTHISLEAALVANSYFSIGCTSCQLIFLQRVHQLPTHISLVDAFIS